MAQYTQRTQPMHSFEGVDVEIKDFPLKKSQSRPSKRKVGRPKKLTTRKITKIRVNTAEESKDRAEIKKNTEPHQNDPLAEPDVCKEEMPELKISGEDTLEGKTFNEPPEKRARLQTSPFQHADDENDYITYEIVIKDDPDSFESEILLPSVISDNVDVEVKHEHPDKTEVMDYEPEQAYQPVVDVKIETTDNVLEEHNENIFSEYKIVSPSVIIEEKSPTTNLPAPKVFDTFIKLLDSLVKQNLISHDQRDILAQYKVDSHLFTDHTQLLNPKLKMKSFAIALYVMSHKAYDYVLRTYKTSLPPLTAVKDWMVQRKGYSGFTRETLEAINLMSKDKGTKKSPLQICLVLKEIKLHHYHYTHRARNQVLSVVGNTTNPLEWSLATANSVMVLTAVAINASWKLPIGYFWDNVFKGAERANLVKVAIDILETAGAVPVAISFESNDDNRQMCEELTASHMPTAKEYFMSHSGIPIFLFPDPCDILELIDKEIKYIECYDESHKVISLMHLPELLKYANIPSEKPMTLKKVIASELCRKDFRFYKGPGAETLTFLEHLQNVLDILSSRNSAQVQVLKDAGQMGKRREDMHPPTVMLREAVMYIKSLKFKDSTESLQAFDRFSSLILLCTLVDTTLMMINKYWRQGSIPFGKFIGNSSYFLANLMPQCNGNKNPTANTFQKEYKAMLEENINKPRENFLMLKCSNPVDIINLTTAIPNGNKLKMIANDFWKLLKCETDEFTEEFVVYVSRYVTTILVYQLHCETCIGAIRNANINMTEDQKVRPEDEKVKKKLVVTKLDEPSSDVMDICKKSEAVYKSAVLRRKWSDIKLCVPLLVSKVLEKYLNRPLFVDLLHHQFDTDRTCNHVIELARAVASSYLNLRISPMKRNVRTTKTKTY